MNDVKVVKLMTGEELICEILSVDDAGVRVKNPVTFLPQGGNSFALVPWVIHAHEDECNNMLLKDSIVAVGPLRMHSEKIVQHYQEINSTIDLSVSTPKDLILP